MTELITNSGAKKHLDFIKSLWGKADEVQVVVAYLKSSGLDNLFDVIKNSVKKGVQQKILCSLDFGLSDPNALSLLRKTLATDTKSGFYLSNEKLTFHPKIYFFEIGEECHIITGSANFTNGGFTENIEISTYHVAPKTDAFVKQTLNYLDRLFSNEFSEPATELKISQYIAFHKEQEEKRKKYQKRKPSSPKSIYKVDYPTLEKFYKEFLKEEDVPSFNKEREESYALAKDILAQLANEELSKSEFRNLYEELVGGKDVARLWHSGSLFRHKAKVIDNYRSFQKMVKSVIACQTESPLEVFEAGLKFKENIPGVGVNILTEVMMTLQPERFANLNKNPLTVLLNVGCNLKKTAANYSGQDYQSYCDLISEIRKELNLKNNLEVDSFFNHNYWKIKGYN